MLMKFRNYCVIVMGNIDDVLIEVESISDVKPSHLTMRGDNTIIITFTSFLSIEELREYFKENKRNLILFELNKETYTYYFNDSDKYNELFTFFSDINNEDLDSKTDCFMQLIKESKSHINILDTEEVDKYCVNNLSKEKRMNIINRIIDNGVDNMSEYDKTLLCFLTNID